jgi:hypothetical protein
MNPLYTEQVRLLVSVLPSIAKSSCFALKGGTAINLFLRDMPRLSVDIDLAYLPVEDREHSLTAIDTALAIIANDIQHYLPQTKIFTSKLKHTDKRFKLIVWQGNVNVKIEVTPVLRGSVYPAEERELCENAKKTFGFVKVPVLNFADLYAGKICAALDRQHPRDLYDIYWLFQREGIDEYLKNAFLIYLISHNRPMVELLAPHVKNIESLYRAELEGMVYTSVKFELLRDVLPALVKNIHAVMTEADRKFLMTFKQGTPDWQNFPIPEAVRLPAVQWKMFNLTRMPLERRKQAITKLQNVLWR